MVEVVVKVVVGRQFRAPGEVLSPFFPLTSGKNLAASKTHNHRNSLSV